MSASLVAALQGNLQRDMAREGAAIAAATRSATAVTSKEVQDIVRRRVSRAFTGGKRTRGGGSKVANAIRQRLYHDAPGKDAGVIYSKFGSGHGPGSFVDYLLPHVRGDQIRAQGGKYLLIPQVSRSKIRAARRVAFIPFAGGLLMVRYQGRGRFTVLAILTKQIKLKARLYLDDVPLEALRRLVAHVTEDLEQQL